MRFVRRWRGVAGVILMTTVTAVILRLFVFRVMYVPSGSMTETLAIDDHIVVNESKTKVVGIERGDIVVFQDPGDWLGETPFVWRFDPIAAITDVITGAAFKGAHPQFLVKRVIGIAGDHVSCVGPCKHLTVNGKQITEPYLSKASANASDESFDVVVPPGHLWLMGDNRVGSADSRAHQDLPSKGFVPISDVIGVVGGIAWPPNRIGFTSDSGSKAFSSLR